MIVCRFSGVGGGVTKWGIEQLISNKLVEYESILFFYFFFIFLNGCASFNLKSALPLFSPNWLKQQNPGLSNKLATKEHTKRATKFLCMFH